MTRNTNIRICAPRSASGDMGSVRFASGPIQVPSAATTDPGDSLLDQVQAGAERLVSLLKHRQPAEWPVGGSPSTRNARRCKSYCATQRL